MRARIDDMPTARLRLEASTRAPTRWVLPNGHGTPKASQLKEGPLSDAKGKDPLSHCKGEDLCSDLTSSPNPLTHHTPSAFHVRESTCWPPVRARAMHRGEVTVAVTVAA